MNQIDTRNFIDNYSAIKSDLENSDFICFDCEFSGLSSKSASNLEVTGYDSAELYYQKIKLVGEQYSLLQLGLSFFKFNKTTKKYDTQTYSFFTNKENINVEKGEWNPSKLKTNMVQFDCLNFLAKQGFDFNQYL